MRVAMMILPVVLQWPPVSTTVSPVNEPADVDVKIAVNGSVTVCVTLENGIISARAPITMSPKNPMDTNCVGLRERPPILLFATRGNSRPALGSVLVGWTKSH